MPVISPPRIPVLVVGDWIVDEDWVLASHESSLASLSAKRHFRAVGRPSVSVRYLAGAGLVARLLYWYQRFDERANFIADFAGPRFDVCGLGTWAKRDYEVIRQMCHPLPLAGLNPFSLTFNSEGDEERAEQLDALTLERLPCHGTMAEGRDWETAREPPEDDSAEQREIGTDRVFRLYRYTEGKLAFAWRIDYETRPKTLPFAEIERAYERPVQDLEEALKKRQNPFGPPFRYGVLEEVRGINRPMFKCLHDHGLINPDTRWFLYTKQHPLRWWEAWRPEWGRARLWWLRSKSLLSPPSGDETIRQPVEWFVKGRQPSADAVEILDDLLRLGGQRNFLDEDRSLVGIMPRGGLEFLAVSRQPERELVGYYNPDSNLRSIEEQITGKETSFFTTLARKMVLEDVERGDGTSQGDASLEGKDPMGESLDVALDFSRRYLAARATNLEQLDEQLAFESIRFDPSHDSSGTAHHQTPFCWNSCRDQWRAAFRGTGILKSALLGNGVSGREREPSLQIWRAMGELPGYVETVANRRREISRLRGELAELKESFAHQRQQHASAMVLAGPGSGKSFLAKKLAESLEMPLHSFNIVQLVTRENVLQCFNSIASAQAGSSRQLHLVIFDEMNAKLQRAFVYDLFLSVIENGTYSWQGRPHKIQPCVWLFLGTRLPEKGESEKASDFCSRLSLGTFDLDVPPEKIGETGSHNLEEQIRLGFVYRAAMLLQKSNPDIQRISAEVLRAFHSLPLKTSVRDLEHQVSRFRDIHYGEVRRRNMPSKLREGLASKAWDEWTEIFDGADLDRKLVRIETEAQAC